MCDHVHWIESRLPYSGSLLPRVKLKTLNKAIHLPRLRLHFFDTIDTINTIASPQRYGAQEPWTEASQQCYW